MKKILLVIPFLIAAGFSIYIGVYYYHNLRGAGPAFSEPPYSIADRINASIPGVPNADLPLRLPEGFAIEIYAENVSSARVIAFDPYGNLWVSRTREGIISVVTMDNGKAGRVYNVVTGLRNPHGLLFDYTDPTILYVAEEDKVSLVHVAYETNSFDPIPFTKERLTQLVSLPSGGGVRSHFTRTLAYNAAGDILVSIGSSCNVCIESDPLRATVQRLVRDMEDNWVLVPYATGLRNAVFLATNPVDGKTWVTEMGRDELGDHLPPDEINILEQGGDYGWPLCYGNRIHDTQFDKNIYVSSPCADTYPSSYDLPAHVSPLGITFIPEHTLWDDEYWLDVLVAYHGSWNRTVPVGYSIYRLILNDHSEIIGEAPFIDGWLTEDNKALGRPVDLVFHNGALYISDDHAGVIYRVWPHAFDEQEVEDSGYADSNDLVLVYGISDGMNFDHTIVGHTFVGQARGMMFFEADFPVMVRDGQGNVVAHGIATAESEWMTTEYVPFTAELTVSGVPAMTSGTLEFHKDNPSGLPEHDYVFSVPIIFGSL